MSGKSVAWAAIVVALSASVALAQQSEEAKPTEAKPKKEIEEVVITGSRIMRDPNLGSNAPVQSVTAEQLKLSGEIDVADVLQTIPALLTSNSPVSGQEFVGGASQGQSILALRGLGTARTLVLVNGRRHVAGVAGTAAVDIGSIPSQLIDRVEVLTGGASSVYGADAVTGVVNFVLKDDYEGFDLNFNTGQSTHGDGQTFETSGIWGHNFDDGRGNVTFATNVSRREPIRAGDRSFTRNNRTSDDLPNPALLFQKGDINPTDTPNFARFYSPDNGRYPLGFTIPTSDMFSADYGKAFGGQVPTLTPAEQALIQRGATAPSRAILRQPTFSISSNRGVIATGDFTRPGLDTDGNGVDDCLDSSVGFNSLVDLSNSFGVAGGCYTVGDDGRVRPLRDGMISGIFNQFGGDGIANNYDVNRITPDDHRLTFNFTSGYQLTDSMRLFGEAKLAFNRTEYGNAINTFYDLLPIAADNPFIPDVLKPVAQQTGGLFVTRDFTDLGRNINRNNRKIYRFVGGLKGEFENGWTYELAGNYGRFRQDSLVRNAVVQDRFYAAIDVVTGPDGKPHCRSDFDPTALPPTSLTGIPTLTSGFFTFRPGDGSCVPADILNGSNSLSPEAQAFITQRLHEHYTIQQYVLSGFMGGNSADFFELPGGPVAFSLGLEYRDEKSQSDFSGLERGVLPIDGPNGAKGTLVGSIPGVSQQSLVFDPATQTRNSGGTFDVFEYFGEVSLPLVRDLPFAETIQLDAAARSSNYSTVDRTFTFNYGAIWAPINDVRFRWTLAEAVRAPNIDELFAPDQGAAFRPNDPCDQAAINALLTAGDPRGPIRAANCAKSGIPVGFKDPLSARFTGVTGGNPGLQEETARTQTLGVVLQPRFLEGMSMSLDLFRIRIEDAISAVSAQNIVDGCYDSANFPNQNCMLFSRNMDPSSPQFLGFNFLRQTQLNFAALATAGLDFGVQYRFDWLENSFTLGLSGTRIKKIDQFFDPMNKGAVDPALDELRRPRYAGNFSFAWQRGQLGMRWNTEYEGKQALRGAQIETAQNVFGRGDAAFAQELFIHNVSFHYDFQDNYELVGGVNNVTGEEPFRTEQSFPVSPVGRFFFLGVTAHF